ncbi:hypothetical protein TNCV_4442771 [Trichonephila clavipes]|nr:hypothetical protein TNCV_4442771 [Trichonephila clavipes]
MPFIPQGCGSPVVKVSDHGRHVMSSSPEPDSMSTTKEPSCKAAMHGYKLNAVRRSEVEALLPDHIQQTAKHPSKQMVWDIFITNGNGRLVPFKGMMNLSNTYKYYAVELFHL